MVWAEGHAGIIKLQRAEHPGTEEAVIAGCFRCLSNPRHLLHPLPLNLVSKDRRNQSKDAQLCNAVFRTCRTFFTGA